jgi:hypothetical protein
MNEKQENLSIGMEITIILITFTFPIIGLGIGIALASKNETRKVGILTIILSILTGTSYYILFIAPKIIH